eukprot:TRINITY_DN64053_c0_g1_i1.p1 TRINITY_DN64053_c0_g1~~TRINITY_DN64053_c0_g1_i1.p1  ORF type:complete len:103 (+),score=3.57 TRINITY_DN64053_c0_g1_i1:40-348(+)
MMFVGFMLSQHGAWKRDGHPLQYSSSLTNLARVSGYSAYTVDQDHGKMTAVIHVWAMGELLRHVADGPFMRVPGHSPQYSNRTFTSIFSRHGLWSVTLDESS